VLNEESVILIAPALTPESWHETGQNPALRKYHYNTSSFELLDFDQYYLNLTAANAGTDTQWQLEYSAKQAYGLRDFQPQSWSKFAAELHQNSSKLNTFYQQYRSLRTDTAPLTAKVKRDLLCLISSQTFIEYETCKL
jgi:hypothetical protein